MVRPNSPDDSREKELWKLCRAGDETASEQLIISYRPLVFWLAARFHASPNIRQDVIQEGMLALVSSVDRFDIDRGIRFSTFAWTRIRGQIINLFERSEKRAPIPLEELSHFDENYWASELDEARDFVEDNIASLPEKEAAVVSALFREGKEAKDIAQDSGLDISHVYRIRRSAIAHLKARLNACD